MADSHDLSIDHYLNVIYRKKEIFISKQNSSGLPLTRLEDLFQDAVSKFYKGFDHFDESRPVEPWFYTIYRRLVTDYLKSGWCRFFRNFSDLVDSDEQFSPNQLFGDNYEVRELDYEKIKGMLDKVLSVISPEKSDVIYRHDVLGQSHSEIGMDLGIGENASSWRYRTGMEDLKKSAESGSLSKLSDSF